jgi:hypothetical protein
MIVLTLNNINNLNSSLQVGDMIYAVTTNPVGAGLDLESNVEMGVNRLVGILRRITTTANTIVLDVDDSLFLNPYIPMANDFLMFSKYSQTDGDVNGYYAEATFRNNSKTKAELFSVGSEIIINSK